MKTLTGLWPTIESMSVPATVLADWQLLLNGDYAAVFPWLDLTKELAETYPCIQRLACGCAHEVVAHSPDNIVAACRCKPAECASFGLEPKDLWVYELDGSRFFGAIGMALGIEATPDTGEPVAGAPKIRFVGIYPRTQSPVYFCFCPTDDLMLGNVSGLIQAQPEPFILLAASLRNKTVRVGNLLQRQRSVFIPLANSLTFDDKGKFEVTNSLQPMLDRFAAGLADVSTIKPVLEGIHRAITAGHEERRELRESKARLEQMHGEGLFGFVNKIDREARELFFAILAAGDTAKASRDLEMSDSTLRSKIAKWRKRGKAYVALAEFVRWRKSIKGQSGIDCAKRLASGADRETDYPALIKDIILDLEEINADNCEEKCDKLANLLRQVTS